MKLDRSLTSSWGTPQLVIVACEVSFWVLILLGLLARYPLRMRRVGLALLVLTPVVDLVLRAATAIDLSRGSTAPFFHGIAAIYLGVSVAYGHKMVTWADARFAQRFAGGPAPKKLYGATYARECWRNMARTIVAVGVAAGVLWALIVISGDPERSAALEGVSRILRIIAAVELIWATSYTFWRTKVPAAV